MFARSMRSPDGVQRRSGTCPLSRFTPADLGQPNHVSSHQTIRLIPGRHSSPERGACVMEVASMLASEPFSDQPRCACPVIAEFLRTYNDRVDEDRRQDLLAYAALAVGTRANHPTERRRADACLEWWLSNASPSAPRVGGLLWRGRPERAEAAPAVVAGTPAPTRARH